MDIIYEIRMIREKKFACSNEGCDNKFTTAYAAKKHSNSSSCKCFTGSEHRISCPNGCDKTFGGTSARQNAYAHSKTTMCENHPDRKPEHKTVRKHIVNDDNTKYCNDCKQNKPIAQFAEKSNVKNNTGRDYICYECRAIWAMYTSTKRKAKEEGNDYNELTKEYIRSLIVYICPVFGTPLQYGGDLQNDNSATVDAVVHSEGHKKGNLRIISKRANTIKNNSTIEEMEQLVLAMKSWIPPPVDEITRKRKAGKKTNSEQTLKICSLCQNEKSINEFHRNSGTQAGLSNRCIRCTALSSMIKNAKVRGKHDVKIDANYLCQLAANSVQCPVLGVPLLFGGTGKIQDNSASIDRFDPLKGYNKGNVWIISYKANRMKSNATVDEIEKVFEYMKNNIK